MFRSVNHIGMHFEHPRCQFRVLAKEFIDFPHLGHNALGLLAHHRRRKRQTGVPPVRDVVICDLAETLVSRGPGGIEAAR
jgi:hypothetical protein